MNLTTDTIRTVATTAALRAPSARLNAEDIGQILLDIVLEGQSYIPRHLLTREHGGSFDIVEGWDQTFLVMCYMAQDFDSPEAMEGYDVGLAADQKVALLKALSVLRASGPISEHVEVEFGAVCDDWGLTPS